MATAHNIQEEIKKYKSVFIKLLVLSVITVGVSYINFGVTTAIIVALIIATIKGLLVACCFMHLLSEKKLIFVLLGFTAFFLLSMLLLIYAAQYNLMEGLRYVS